MTGGRSWKIELAAHEMKKPVATGFHPGEEIIGLGVLAGTSAAVWAPVPAAAPEAQCNAADPCRQDVRKPRRVNSETRRLSRATEILEDAMLVPERSIPRDLVSKASCVAVFPEAISSAFWSAAVKSGPGFVSCRAEGGTDWSAPAGILIGKATVGRFVGFKRRDEVDLVAFIMNQQTVDFMLADGAVVLGEPTAAVDTEKGEGFRVVRSVPGPVGSDAAPVDGAAVADVFAWSVSRGLISGVSIVEVLMGHLSEYFPSGFSAFSALRHPLRRTLPVTSKKSEELNEKLYGKKLTSREILLENKALPTDVGQAFISVLTRYSRPRM